MAFLRRPAVEPNARREADAEGLPVYGLLGHFNRYMALQEYVRLDPDAPEWRGWRGRLRCLGIRLPAPVPRKPSAFLRWLRDFKLQLPEGLSKRLKLLRRVALIAVPLAVIALCLDTGQRVRQYDKAEVSWSRGHPTVLRVDKSAVPLPPGAILEGASLPAIRTDQSHSLTLELADSRLKLAPDTSLRITQMSYSGTRQRRMELLNGEIQAEIAPEAPYDPPGYYDLIAGEALVQAQPIETATTLSLTVQSGGVLVRVARGLATVSAHGVKKQLPAGYQLVVQTGRPPSNPSVMPLKDSQKLIAEVRTPVEAQASFLAHWRGLYAQAQQRTLMPFAAQAMTWLKLKPDAQNVMAEAATRLSLYAMYKMLEGGNEPPASVDHETLEEIGSDETARKRWLNTFADHKLVAYYVENGSCTLLARVNNANRTLLKMHRDEVVVIPENQEEEELKKAEPK